MPKLTSPLYPRQLEIGAYLAVTQLGWFVCVLAGARGRGWIGLVFAALAVLAHLRHAQAWRHEAVFIALAVSIGWLWECLLVRAGLLVYPGQAVANLAPFWMAGLWALFAIQFNSLLTWLQARLLLGSLLGAVAAPLSFRAGAALGAVHFPAVPSAMLALAAGWALLMPLLLALARRWDGMRQGPGSALHKTS